MEDPTICRICGRPLPPSYIGKRRSCQRCAVPRDPFTEHPRKGKATSLAEEKKELIKIVHSYCRGEMVETFCPNCPIRKYKICGDSQRIAPLRQAVEAIKRMRGESSE